MFETIFSGFAQILNAIYSVVHNYGIAITLFTILLMALITPLTVKSTRSMMEMQRLQPELKRIQTQYKDDREKMNAAVMEFYREHKVNPLGGCVPLLAQSPIFLIMYRLISGLTIRDGGIGSATGHIGAQVGTGATPTRWILTDQVFKPAHLDVGSQLYRDLHATTRMSFLGMDLSQSTLNAVKAGFVGAIPYLILIIVILISGIYQQRQISARNTGATVNSQQQMIMKLFPFFLPIFSFSFAAGLALYWSVQNLCRIVTNAYITRSLYRKEHATGAIETTATETKSGGSKPAKAVEKTKPTGPGRSAKSQAAHKKAKATAAGGSGTTRTSGAGGRSSGSRRRSGESRGSSGSK